VSDLFTLEGHSDRLTQNPALRPAESAYAAQIPGRAQCLLPNSALRLFPLVFQRGGGRGLAQMLHEEKTPIRVQAAR
jgi:hypothetical protein